MHGSGGGEGIKNKSKEEQEIADFLSSIDEMTSAGKGPGGEVNLHGGSSGGGGRDLLLGSTLPPTQQQQRATNGDASELSAIADAFPADWLQGMEGLGLGDQSGSSAQPPTPPPQQQEHVQQPPTPPQGGTRDDHQPRLTEERSNHAEPEILGEEPEILDDVDGGGYDGGAAAGAAGTMASTGGGSGAGRRVASWATSAPASFVSAATAALRGDARRAAGGSQSATATAGPTAATAEDDAFEPPLDWPGALDMLGMAEAEAENNNGDSTAVAPGSGLPSMPPPASREKSFPDFVEIRDPRNVSQFPKPDNALVAKVVAAGDRSGRGGDGQAGEGDSSSGGGVAAGPETGKEQGQWQRQALPAPLRTVEVYLRPDVTWESVSDVYMAVMLSRGLVVRRQTEKTVRWGPEGGALASISLQACLASTQLNYLLRT